MAPIRAMGRAQRLSCGGLVVVLAEPAVLKRKKNIVLKSENMSEVTNGKKNTKIKCTTRARCNGVNPHDGGRGTAPQL